MVGIGFILSMMLLSCSSNEIEPEASALTKKVTRLMGKTSTPSAITMDRRGNLYVANYEKGCVEVIMPDGMKTVFAEGLTTPTGIAVDSKGKVYVCEALPGTVQCIHPCGTMTCVADGLSYPSGITIGRDGHLFVACKGDDSIVKVGGGQVVEPMNVTIQVL